MKITGTSLLGVASGILIISLLVTTVQAKRENTKLKEINNSLSITVDEQKETIESLNITKTNLETNYANLEAEKNNLTNQVSELTEKNKQLEQKISTQSKSTQPKTTAQPQTTTTPKATTKSSTGGKNLGQFRISAYCNCSKCCGKWAGGPTASGTTPKAGRTIAVDPKVIPLGSKVIIDGHTYIAEDTGSAIKGNKIDMYFSSHSEAMAWGVKYKNVSLG